jgi:hypothetical protein
MAKDDATPIRTLLFVGGSEHEEVLRAAGHGADAIVIDLEEPRTPYPEHEREATRLRMRDFFDGPAGNAGSPRWFVRVQPPDTGQTLKDLRAVMGPHLAGVLLPKVYGPEDVYRLESLLTCLEAEVDLPLGSTVVYPILETAQSLRLAYDIAVASPRVQYMGGAVSRFGDIHQALGYRWTEEGRETLFLRSKVLVRRLRQPALWGKRRLGASAQRDGEEGDELLAAGHVRVAGRPTGNEARHADLDGQGGLELEDAHLVGLETVERPDHLFGQDLLPHDVEKRLAVLEEEIEGHRERAYVLAADRGQGILQRAGRRVGGHRSFSDSSLNVSNGSSTSMAWCTLNRKTSPMSWMARVKGQARVVPPRQPGLLAWRWAYQMTLEADSQVAWSGATTSRRRNASCPSNCVIGSRGPMVPSRP